MKADDASEFLGEVARQDAELGQAVDRRSVVGKVATGRRGKVCRGVDGILRAEV